MSPLPASERPAPQGTSLVDGTDTQGREADEYRRARLRLTALFHAVMLVAWVCTLWAMAVLHALIAYGAAAGMLVLGGSCWLVLVAITARRRSDLAWIWIGPVFATLLVVAAWYYYDSVWFIGYFGVD